MAQTMATNPFRKTVVAQMSRIWETLKANQFSKWGAFHVLPMAKPGESDSPRLSISVPRGDLEGLSQAWGR